jgi:hypothetical protein
VKKGTVVFLVEHILHRDSIKNLMSKGIWPDEWAERSGTQNDYAHTTQAVARAADAAAALTLSDAAAAAAAKAEEEEDAAAAKAEEEKPEVLDKWGNTVSGGKKAGEYMANAALPPQYDSDESSQEEEEENIFRNKNKSRMALIEDSADEDSSDEED